MPNRARVLMTVAKLFERPGINMVIYGEKIGKASASIRGIVHRIDLNTIAGG